MKLWVGYRFAVLVVHGVSATIDISHHVHQPVFILFPPSNACI